MASQLNSRPLHRAPHATGWWVTLRIFMAMTLAVLALPFLGASASAEEELVEEDTSLVEEGETLDPPPEEELPPAPETEVVPEPEPEVVETVEVVEETTSPKTTTSRTTGGAAVLDADITPLVECEPGEEVGIFEIDGNVPVTCEGNDDFENKGTVSNDLFDDGTQFTSGSKEMDNPSTWTNGVGTSPGKDDIGKVYLYNTTIGGDVWSFFGFTRDAATGTTAFDVEYNQQSNVAGSSPTQPVRTEGDLLIQLEQEGNKGFKITDAFIWTVDGDGLAKECYTVPGYTPTSGWCPLTLTSDVFVGATSADGFFAEGALNITELLGGGATCIGDFGTMNIRSRASTTPTSALKDWVVPQSVDIPGTCADIKIVKLDAVTGDPLGGATFTITPSPVPGVTGGTVTVTDNDTDVTTGEVADKNSQVGHIKVEPVEPDTYAVTETVAPEGYFLPSPVSQQKTVTANGSVTFTFEDKKKFTAPTVDKTVTAKYDALYNWSIAKVVKNPGGTYAASASQEVPAGTDASFDYRITVTQGTQVRSNFRVSGTATVSNPNDRAMVVTLSDTLSDGTVCTFPGVTDASVAAGLQVTLPAESSPQFGYTCSPGNNAQDGSNTAVVTWDTSVYPQTQAQANASSGTDSASTGAKAYAFEVDQETDKTVTITDSRHTFDPAWTKTWTAGASPESREYTLEFSGVAGECRTYPNTATLDKPVGTDLTASAGVEVCVGVDLSVTKNVVHSYDRTYTWDLDKDVDSLRKNVDPETGTATFDYTVSLRSVSWEDSDWQMSGTATVSNPNVWQAVTLSDITDAVDVGGGAVCTITNKADLTIPAATKSGDTVTPATRAFGYTCTFATQPSYTGTNTATITWDSSTYSTPTGSDTGSASVTAANWSETPINKFVDVLDDQTDPANPVLLASNVEWGPEGDLRTYTYSLALEGTEGQCVDYTNTAWFRTTGTTPKLDPTSQKVTVCWPLDLSVEKESSASYDTRYFWDVEKSADKTEVEIAEGGEATFTYTVVAVEDGSEDLGWELSGDITVENPNLFKSETVTLDDVYSGGGTCEVLYPGGGDDVVVPAATEAGPGSVTVGYECEFTEAPAYSGTNTVTVNWGDGSSSSFEEDITFAQDQTFDETVTVTDDKTNPAAPAVTLGEVTWGAPLVDRTFTYDLTKQGVAGACTDYTNTATVEVDGTDPFDTETVTVCVEDGLDVSKTASASHDRTYFWSIDKAADRTSVEILGDGSATFDYTVLATPGGFADSGWTMGGTISVTNPNTYADGDITATVTDLASVGGGAICTVSGGTNVLIPAGQTVPLNYSCSFGSQPTYTGTNTATATWTGPDQQTKTASGSTGVSFDIDGETNKVVTVTDNMTSPTTLGTATWNSGGTATAFNYSLTHQGTDGTCVDFTNTATITQTGQNDSATVEVCDQGDLVVAKTVEASYDRTYLWAIEKDADQTRIDTELGETGTVNYTVMATPDGFVDDGWEMAGSVTVLNPNDYKDVTVSLSDVPEVGEGATCTFDEAEDLVVAAGETDTFTYTCTFEGQPDYEGTNTVTVGWGSGSVSTTTDVVFAQDGATNETVTVTDDLADPSELGEAVWNGEGEPTTFEYAMEFEGPVNTCETVTNTATIVETDQSDQAAVEVCGPEVLGEEEERPPVEKPKPRPPAILPDTGAPVNAGLWSLLGGLMVALGAALLLRRRRELS